ncbi:MAG: hypothetical protein HZB16_08535 [Armatimonadetes bacterium]|nr:hypothetical protein [Armatimonadota bacterium]
MTRALLVVLTLCLATSAHGADLPLTLDWAGPPPARALPVTGGLPLARGVLRDERELHLLAGGAELPLQTRTLAVWPDGSLKWVLLDFQTTAASLTLRWGVGPRALPAGIVARAEAGGVSLDTGALRLSVRGDGCGFVDELAAGGQPALSAGTRRLNVLDFLHTAAPADYTPQDRWLKQAQSDPSRIVVQSVSLEQAGPLHAVVLVTGVYRYALVGSTITGTEVRGDCPFRLRLHAYAGSSLLRVEHFFSYEGDGDHDFGHALSLRLPAPAGAATVRFVGAATAGAPGPLAGLYQPDAGSYQVWRSEGRALERLAGGRRFEGLMDVSGPGQALAVGVRGFWQQGAKSLHADLRDGLVCANLWAPEAPPLDFRRHAREKSVGEAGGPDVAQGTQPEPFAPRGDGPWRNYRLASKGVGKSHDLLFWLHDPALPESELRAGWRWLEHRPLLWAPPHHYAASLALGPYRERVATSFDDIEAALERPVDFWRQSREKFGWYGFWLYGNVAQSYNEYIPNGRWATDFGRWGWANGDSVGRLAYALMLQAVRKGERADFEFAESYLRHVHDVCSVHTPAWPENYSGNWVYVKGAAHRHDSWPWGDLYVGARGAHPVGAKIDYYLTGDGRAKDILDEITQLALRNPNGGAGDGPLGPNAQIFLYQWEATGDPVWLGRLRAELDGSELLKTAEGGWLVMMSAAFGIKDALDEYIDLTGDRAKAPLAASFAERCLPAQMKNHWTWGGYFRVYAAAYRFTGDAKYRRAIEDMLPRLREADAGSAATVLPPDQWPGLPGGPSVFVDGNIIRDIPFALAVLAEEGR